MKMATNWASLLMLTASCVTDRALVRAKLIQAEDLPYPPLHWHSWNTFDGENEVNATNMHEMADTLLSTGLAGLGYDTVNVVCNGWTGRDSSGRLTENKKLWPQGIKAFGDYLHANNLKLGCYTSPATRNCCGEPGSLGYEDIDMQTFADWGCDHVMVDWCHAYVDPMQTRDEYAKIGAAIAKTNRSMLYGIWPGGFGKSWKWSEAVGGNYWRTAQDITNSWESVLFNFDTAYSIPGIAEFSKPGHFTFLDQMVVGVVPGPGHIGGPGLSLEEARSHMTMWSIAASPLMICNDVRNMTADIKSLLTNEEVLNVHKDPLARMAQRVDVGGYADAHADQRTSSVYDKPLANGDHAVMVLNRATTTQTITVLMEDIGDSMHYRWQARDLWKQIDLPNVTNSMTLEVPGHGVRYLRLTEIEPPP